MRYVLKEAARKRWGSLPSPRLARWRTHWHRLPRMCLIAALTSLLPNPINHKIEVAVEYVDNLIGRCRHCGHCEPMPEPQPVVCRSCGSVCCEGLDVALKH